MTFFTFGQFTRVFGIGTQIRGTTMCTTFWMVHNKYCRQNRGCSHIHQISKMYWLHWSPQILHNIATWWRSSHIQQMVILCPFSYIPYMIKMIHIFCFYLSNNKKNNYTKKRFHERFNTSLNPELDIKNQGIQNSQAGARRRCSCFD